MVSSVFEWAIMGIVLVDISLIIALLSISDKATGMTLRYFNCVAVGVYTSEAVLKVCFVLILGSTVTKTS